MSDKLEVLKAELEQLEAQGRYDAPQYRWLAETVERLEREEAAKPPPVPEPEQASGTDLASRLAAMTANPGRFTDAEQRTAIEELNQQVRATTAAMLGADDDEPEAEDVAALAAQMRAAAAQGSSLDPDEAATLGERFSRAVRHQASHAAPSAELRGLLAGSDLQARYEAAAELQRRGELEPGVGDAMIGWFNEQVRAADQAGPLDPYQVSEGPLRELVADMAAQVERDEAERRGQDPRDALISRYNATVRAAGEQAREPLAGVGAATTEPTNQLPEEA